MSKDLVIKVGEYQKDGETKGEYVKLGVILSNDNGEYALIDPTINIAGCLMKQRVMNQGKQNSGKGDMVMCGIYDRDSKSAPQQQAPADHGFGDKPPF